MIYKVIKWNNHIYALAYQATGSDNEPEFKDVIICRMKEKIDVLQAEIERLKRGIKQ